MVIYGVATLSVSLLAGLFLGDLLGRAINVEANVGGVGIAMLILLVLANRSGGRLHLAPITAQGITFWSAMYIPIVVAMAARQNVVAAMSGGALALLAGTLAVAGGFALIPVLARFHAPHRKSPAKGGDR
jgi:malonate transporter MadL subunit